MTIRIPKWVLGVLGGSLVLGVVAAAYFLGRSTGEGDQPPQSGSEPGTASVAAETAECSEDAAEEATIGTGFADAIIATGEVKGKLSGVEIEPIGASGEFFDPMSGYRPGILECRDLTGDGVDEMVFAPSAGASGSIFNWAIFASDADGEWELAFHREGVKVTNLKIRGDAVVERSPTYLENEPMCCPSGNRTTEIADEGNGFEVVSPVASPDERRIEVSSEGVESLGQFDPNTDSSPDALATFGTASFVTKPFDEVCRYSWDDLGLAINFANLGGRDPCGPEGRVGSIELVGAPATQAGWETEEGARVGMSGDELRDIYPEATASRGQLVLIQKPTAIGASGVTPALSAYRADGRAVAFFLSIGAAGD